MDDAHNHTERILIVDDAPENIDILASALKGYKKSIALNGEKALKLAFGDNPPDLILLDIMMPIMDGFEVCKRLKADLRTKDIPIIFLTGKTDTESIVKGFELGAVDYVTKPFNTSELLVRVNTQITLKKSKDAIERYVSEIENKNQLITDSINYASRIQTAILPLEHQLSELLGEHFVFFRPKDIVSGDFYWARKVQDKAVIIAADCTGHGVPGAFMSMFGVAFLNEIVGKEGITSPANILDRLREKIIESLGQDSGNNVKDGMDMAIITIDKNENKLEYAGAQNPLYMIRDNELEQIKADRMPVSIFDRMDEFTNHTIDLEKNDQFYIFSDGYADQFGGESNRKFKYKALKELLLENSNKTMKEQKEALDRAFMKWKGENEQVDDIVVMGIKV